MSGLLREQDVKVAFIDWLFRKGLLENATIINEMVVANWSRRADLAVANGHLQAFEIKSDFDSLKRLDGQLETFTSRFEKVTVVCAPKFTYEISKKVSPDVGVIEYLNTNKGIRFKIVQRGRKAIISNKKVYINFLLKKELQLLLIENGKRFLFESGREALERVAEQISLSRIRGFVLEAIKERYKETSNDYLEKLAANELSNTSDLSLLSKS
ncbi:TPA: sce7726 family protein, partial [Salmonella enterica subsp. enterica serovar Orion]